MTKVQEEKILSEINYLKKRVLQLEEYNDLHKLNRTTYTVAEVAVLLNKQPQSVRLMIQRGELEATKLGITRITGESLKKAMNL